MALTIALPLSGLEPDQFSALGSRLFYEHGFRTLTGCGPISPSTASESSGVSSLVPSIESTTPEQTPASSRPSTPAEEPPCKKQEKVQTVHSPTEFQTTSTNESLLTAERAAPCLLQRTGHIELGSEHQGTVLANENTDDAPLRFQELHGESVRVLSTG